MDIDELLNQMSELSRRLASLITPGTVEEADYDRALVRVRSGDQLSDWRPWLTTRASNDKTWWAPEVGEQVVLISPSGDPAQGYVLAAVYQTSHAPPANAETVHRIEYADGTMVEYDRAAHHLRVECVGDITIETLGATTVNSAETVTVISGADVTVSASGAASVTSGANVDVTATGAATLASAVAVTVTAPIINLN